MVPGIIRTKHHGHNVGSGLGEPAWKLIVGDDSCCQVSSMALVLAIVGEATSLAWESAHEIRVGDSGLLQLLPKKSAPTSLVQGQHGFNEAEEGLVQENQ